VPTHIHFETLAVNVDIAMMRDGLFLTCYCNTRPTVDVPDVYRVRLLSDFRWWQAAVWTSVLTQVSTTNSVIIVHDPPPPPFSSNRQHRSDNCLEVRRENNQNCSVL